MGCRESAGGTGRTTFVIDEQGTVTHIIDKVNNKDAAICYCPCCNSRS